MQHANTLATYIQPQCSMLVLHPASVSKAGAFAMHSTYNTAPVMICSEKGPAQPEGVAVLDLPLLTHAQCQLCS